MAYGYRRIRLSKTTTRDEHRLIMEERLGIKLGFNEIVHHENENKKDNDPDNLKLMSRAEHSRLHFPHGQPLSEETMEKLRQIYKGKPKYYCAKYTKEQIKYWYNKRQCGKSLRYIERRTGVNHGTISRILNGKVLAYREILNEIKQS